jgi:hypothetical protein
MVYDPVAGNEARHVAVLTPAVVLTASGAHRFTGTVTVALV